MKILLSILFTSFSVFAEMPEPYKSVNDLPFDGHGWFLNENYLAPIIYTNQPKTVIEIGSWLGCSTRFIASHMPEDGVLYAIDTWRGTSNEAVHMQDARLPYLYQLFLSNVKHAGLTHKIIPVRMDSIEASKALNVKADLIYLDGAHDAESVYNDIISWHPHLNENGVICGDDWAWASVQDGVKKAAEKLNKAVVGSDFFWRFQ